jgi:hypothetical protein
LVKALARLALEGVARNVATFDPSPDTPVEMGRPVAFVNVPLDGVPNAGVTRVGDVANTKAPEPVSPVTADAKFALDGVAKKVPTPDPNPSTPVAIGNPVALVKVRADGVPRSGVMSAGESAKTSAPVPVSSPTMPASSDEVSISPLDNAPPALVPSPSLTHADPLY